MSRTIAAACALASLVATSGCALTESKSGAKGTATDEVSVTSSADTCDLSTTTATSGRLVFTVKNTGKEVTEFYVYDAKGTAILGEVENIGPGLSRDLVLTAAPGTYVTACKPGMTGQGIRADFTVKDSGKKVAAKGVDEDEVAKATATYKSYVEQQSSELLSRTTQFLAAYRAGHDDKARSLYADARVPWERIEPVAESFGDLDPAMDLREADLEQGQKWTGWHLIEKDLWPPAKGYRPLATPQRAAYAADLLAHTRELHERVGTTTFTVAQIGNGSKGLLDEVARTKITGEEEVWSHTDLWDVQANVDGAKAGFEAVEDILKGKDAELYEQVEDEFDDLQKVLDSHRSGDGFASYDEVDQAQRKQLSDAVNALAEPLSKVTGVITL